MIRRLSLGALVLLLVGLAGYTYHDQQRMAGRLDAERRMAAEDRRLAALDRADLKAQVSTLRQQLLGAGIAPAVPEPTPEPPPTPSRVSVPRSRSPATTARPAPPATTPPPPTTSTTRPPPITTTTACRLPVPVVGCVP